MRQQFIMVEECSLLISVMSVLFGAKHNKHNKQTVGKVAHSLQFIIQRNMHACMHDITLENILTQKYVTDTLDKRKISS